MWVTRIQVLGKTPLPVPLGSHQSTDYHANQQKHGTSGYAHQNHLKGTAGVGRLTGSQGSLTYHQHTQICKSTIT
jgi:hypothetical protein